jgi:Ca2+-binding RTX toxin-like protein
VRAIQVNGTDGDESVTIDQKGSAPFPHQNTTSIDFALGAGMDALVIAGHSTADSIGFGADGISLDAGGTPDVTGIGTVESFSVDAGGGDDTVSGKGGGGLGGEFSTAITIHGEAGNDALTGGGGNDTSSGGTGSDTLKGADGSDVVSGRRRW